MTSYYDMRTAVEHALKHVDLKQHSNTTQRDRYRRNLEALVDHLVKMEIETKDETSPQYRNLKTIGRANYA